MNSRPPPGAVSPTTVLATTNTGWPLWKAWSPRRGWPIQPRSLHERKPGPPPTEAPLTGSPSSFFNRETPDARWLLLGSRALSRPTGSLQHASADALGEREYRRSRTLGFAASAGLGTLLGMRHALEPDHLAAVSTLMTGERSSAKAAWLGAWWGLGHTLTLFTAGALLVVLQAEMPAIAARDVRGLRGPAARRLRCARDPSGRSRECPQVRRIPMQNRAMSALSRRPMDTRTTTPGGRRAWTSGQRRAHCARGGDTPLHGDTADLSDAIWCRIHRGDGRALGAPRLADRTAWAPITLSCARSRWSSAVSRPRSVCSGAIRSSKACS